MEHWKAICVGLTLAALVAAPVYANDGDPKDNSGDQGQKEVVEMPPTELDLPVEESVKVKVEPFVASPVVDRIVEPAAVTVESKNTTEVNVFVVPVDSPYGGKALEKPHLVGKDDTPADGFKVKWTQKETSPYVKLFAVITHKTGFPREVRSHTMDFGIGGKRLETPPAKTQPKP